MLPRVIEDRPTDIRPRRRRRNGGRLGAVTGLAIAGLLLVGFASAAAAPTLSVNRPCFTPGEEVFLSGSGYTPNGPVPMVVQVASPNVAVTSNLAITADAAGAIPRGSFLSFDGLFSRRDVEETVTVTALDHTRIQNGEPVGPETTASTQFKLSIFDLAVAAWDAERVDPRRRTSFTVRGGEPWDEMYLLYVLRRKVVKRVRLGALTGPCGNLRRTMRQFPFRPVPPGSYSIYVAGQRTARPEPNLLFYRNIRVTRAKAVR